MSKHPGGFFKRLKTSGKTLLQSLFLTLQLFTENGLANHAAAGAYGFLLSAAPALLLASFFVLSAFRTSLDAIIDLLMDIPYLQVVLDKDWLINNYHILARPGITALISVVSILWAGRIFALSLQCGLNIIFTGAKKRRLLAENMIILFIEFLVLLFALVMILCSRTALWLYRYLDFIPQSSVLLAVMSKVRLYIIPAVVLAIISYCIYRVIPVNAPRRISALLGSAAFLILYVITSFLLQLIINQTRYNFLYGALGNLIILLVNVYFFFIFFFLGAQLARVVDLFDVLLFSKLHKTQAALSGKKTPARRNMTEALFCFTGGRLEKYLRVYRKGETIFSKGDRGGEIFFLLEGEVDVYTPAAFVSGKPASILHSGSFFGEMGHLLSENRNATVKARTGVSALALPSLLFDEILRNDAGLDRAMIEHLSHRLKNANERLDAAVSTKPPQNI